MRLMIAMPRLRTIGRVHVALWAARAQWGQAHEYLELQHDQPFVDGYDNVLWNYEAIQRRFLASSCDALLTVEDDVIIPPDAITRLAAHLKAGVDIAYGLYCLRIPKHPWNAYTVVREADDPRAAGQAEGMSIVWDNVLRSVDALNAGSVLPVEGVGLGCTLIRRTALEAIPFRRSGGACNDWYFAVDAQRAGLRQVCDFGVVCGHVMTKEARYILWPSATEPQLYRREYLD